MKMSVQRLVGRIQNGNVGLKRVNGIQESKMINGGFVKALFKLFLTDEGHEP
jgi:hypothetical protein